MGRTVYPSSYVVIDTYSLRIFTENEKSADATRFLAVTDMSGTRRGGKGEDGEGGKMLGGFLASKVSMDMFKGYVPP
jgi:hypothetical protein